MAKIGIKIAGADNALAVFTKKECKSRCSTYILIGADEGTRTPMVSHRNLKPARLPISPHPLISRIFFAHKENAVRTCCRIPLNGGSHSRLAVFDLIFNF